jgi:hypothetical protein
MQKLHADDVQKIPSGGLKEIFSCPPDGIKCILAGWQNLHIGQKEIIACWPKGNKCRQARRKKLRVGLWESSAGRK